MIFACQKWFIIVLVFVLLLPVCVISQDEDILVAAENELVDGAIEGDLPVLEELDLEELPLEDLAADLEEVALPDMEELAVEEIAIPEMEEVSDPVAIESIDIPEVEEAVAIEEDPAMELEELSVENLAAETLDEAVAIEAEPIAEEMAELPVEEEPAIEEMAELPVEEELAIEEMAELPVEEELAIEEMVELPVEEMVELPVEEEPVEELIEEVAEIPMVEEAPEESLEDMLGAEAEIGFDDVIAEAVGETVEKGIPDIQVEVPDAGVAPTAAGDVPLVKEKLVDLTPEEMARRKEISVVSDQEQLRRWALEAHGVENLNEGRKALDASLYDRAITLFHEAMKSFIRPESEELRVATRKSLAKAYYEYALSLQRQDELEDALKQAKKAVSSGHPKGEGLVAHLKYLQENPIEKAPPPHQVRWKQEDYLDKREEILSSLKRAREYMATYELDKALEEAEHVLATDPYNTEAERIIQKVGHKTYDRNTQEYMGTRADMLSIVRKTWLPRDYDVDLKYDESKNKEKSTTKKDTGILREKIEKKMKDIIIPEIDFRLANINDVISFLVEASREYDTTDEGNPGVNIILSLGGGMEGGAAPVEEVEEDPFAMDIGGDTGGGDTSAAGSLITFSARYISLYEALGLVTKIADLRHRIDGSIVMVVRKDAPVGDIIQRIYNILPSTGDVLANLGSEAEAGGGDDNRIITINEGLSKLGEAKQDWKAFFGSMGVEWPQGSEIRYISAISKIIVANTADNLTKFERIFDAINVLPNQIEIEARFVEVSQQDIDSLGFEWMLTDNWEILQEVGSGTKPLSMRPRVQMNANQASDGFTTGLRFVDSFTSAEGGTTPIADTVMTFASVLTNPELAVAVHMLQQRGSADLLSAPKVTTVSGAEAEIKVVKEYIYPTEFTVTPIMGQTGGVGGGVTVPIGGMVEPSSFQTREVGVLLSVLPEVSPEGRMINLTVTPAVVDEPEWKDYGSTYNLPDGSVNTVPMPQPFFPVRMVTTTVSVFNGATIVLGGMITERRFDVEDSIPFLGSIPVIGRLFRSKYERSDKRNLLIFLTARLVDQAGRPIQDLDILPDIPLN